MPSPARLSEARQLFSPPEKASCARHAQTRASGPTCAGMEPKNHPSPGKNHVGAGALTRPVERSSTTLFVQKRRAALARPDEGVWAYVYRNGTYERMYSMISVGMRVGWRTSM